MARLDEWDIIAGEQVEASREWVKKIDRSRLGSFANPSENLVIVHASMRWNTTADMQIPISQSVRIVLSNWTLLHVPFRDRNAVEGEVFFWSDKVDGDASLVESPMTDVGTVFDTNALDWWNKYKIVEANPINIPYYSVGIWDDAFIARCRAEDIDPSMALDMVR